VTRARLESLEALAKAVKAWTDAKCAHPNDYKPGWDERSDLCDADNHVEDCPVELARQDVLAASAKIPTLDPKVGERVAWFDIGPMKRYEGVVVRVTSDTMLSVQQDGRPDPTTVFHCDLEPLR
jgi:hypothetical protein